MDTSPSQKAAVYSTTTVPTTTGMADLGSIEGNQRSTELEVIQSRTVIQSKTTSAASAGVQVVSIASWKRLITAIPQCKGS
jgi:hypothetical protein